MATSEVTPKLLINKMERKVLYAEANKDFVDFLFYIHSLPVGSIVKLLKDKTTMMGCLGDLYQSIETLSETYMQSNQDKNSVLNPKSPKCPTEIPLFLPDNNTYESKALKSDTCSRPDTTSRHLYRADSPFSLSSSSPFSFSSSCQQTMNSGPFSLSSSGPFSFSSSCQQTMNSGPFSLSSSGPFSFSSSCQQTMNSGPFSLSSSGPFSLSSSPFSFSSSCQQTMNSEMTFASQVASTSTAAAVATERGFVKDMVYMVMDNLEVTPMSTISCITLLKKFNIRDLGSLEEKVVNFGLDEGLKLLKASMECKNVLTTVFLGNLEA